MENILLVISGITILALVLNLPFGYLRSKCKRLSVTWFLYIHLPIPFIILARNIAGLSYKVIPIVIVGAVIGQFIGGRLNPERIS